MEAIDERTEVVRRHLPPEAVRLLGWWLVGVVVAIGHNGLWATPNLSILSSVARHLGSNPLEGSGADYVLTDLLDPVLARALGQTSPAAWVRLHLMLLVAGWALVTVLAMRRFGYRVARSLTVALAVSPLVTVSMQWAGQPDPVTATFGILMVVVRRRWAVLAVGVLAGLTHPEQAVFMALVAVAVRAVLSDDGPVAEARTLAGEAVPDRPSVLRRTGLDACLAVGGVLLGRVLTEIYFRLAGIVVTHPRSRFLKLGPSRFVDHHLQQPLGLLWTLWGPLWLVVLAVGILRLRRRGSDRRSARAWTVLAATAVAALVPVLVTLDETRVYAVITAPLILGAAVLVDRERPPVPGRVLAWSCATLLVVALAVPGGFATGVTSWRGQIDTPEMLHFLRTGEHPGNDLTLWLLSPFHLVIPRL